MKQIIFYRRKSPAWSEIIVDKNFLTDKERDILESKTKHTFEDRYGVSGGVSDFVMLVHHRGHNAIMDDIMFEIMNIGFRGSCSDFMEKGYLEREVVFFRLESHAGLTLIIS